MLEDSTTTTFGTGQEWLLENVEKALEEMKEFSETQMVHRESELPECLQPFFKTFMCFGVRVRW